MAILFSFPCCNARRGDLVHTKRMKGKKAVRKTQTLMFISHFTSFYFVSSSNKHLAFLCRKGHFTPHFEWKMWVVKVVLSCCLCDKCAISGHTRKELLGILDLGDMINRCTMMTNTYFILCARYDHCLHKEPVYDDMNWTGNVSGYKEWRDAWGFTFEEQKSAV